MLKDVLVEAAVLVSLAMFTATTLLWCSIIAALVTR